MQFYKIENGIKKVNWVDEYERGAPRRGMRGHIRKEIVSNCQQRNNFFKNRIANDWNRLPVEITIASSTNAFKNKLTRSSKATTAHFLLIGYFVRLDRTQCIAQTTKLNSTIIFATLWENV